MYNYFCIKGKTHDHLCTSISRFAIVTTFFAVIVFE